MSINYKPSRVSITFADDNVPMFIEFSRNVVAQMTGNTNFATPNPALTEVTMAIDALDLASQAARDRGRQAMLTRNSAEAALLALMRSLAAYVQSHCQNDQELLSSSGFLPTKTPAPIGPLVAPLVPKVRQGPTTGTLKARTGKVKGAYAYNWRVALASAPGAYLQTVQTTGANALFEGLTPGQLYNVEMNALGTYGPSDWTAVTSQMVI